MRTEHGWQILIPVTVRTMHIAIDVGIDGEQISGRAGDGTGRRARWQVGWV